MQLQLSVLARYRLFSKAMRRTRMRLQPVMDAFENVSLEHPIHEAILVLVTDDDQPEFFQKIENKDGFFQVLAGCSLRGTDDELAEDTFEILRRATILCPFATPDREQFEALFERLRPTVLNNPP